MSRPRPRCPRRRARARRSGWRRAARKSRPRLQVPAHRRGYPRTRSGSHTPRRAPRCVVRRRAPRPRRNGSPRT
ncbi:MAG: hypothetical protein E6G32_04815 [Actinobacteria bacterium]|nr:MAG: hypothetical protein E6G64_11715 [Actinomycetota bacterium]TML23954.1 MAG: hypothetical protein E6G32_04815 [Actinomycetota bacterium]